MENSATKDREEIQHSSDQQSNIHQEIHGHQRPEQDENEDNWLLDNYKSIRIGVFFASGFYTLIFLAVTGAVGYGLDQYFGTYPKLLIVGILVGYPINRFLLSRKFKNYAEKKLTDRKKEK